LKRIISIDGGGVRGIIPVTILRRIQEQVPFVISNTDILAGTSIGGIISLMLAHNIPLEYMETFLLNKSKEIFKRRWFASGIVDSKYTNKGIIREFSNEFKKTTMNELRKKVIVTSFDLNENHDWQPKFFHNFSDSKDLSTSLIDVTLSTCAAPTYFPIYKGYIDGGVCANNPSMASWAISNQYYKEQDVCILSLGTGNALKHIHSQNKSWGLFQWISNIISILMEAPNEVIDNEAQLLLGGNYFKVNPIIKKKIMLDDISKVEYLHELAMQYDISEVVSWLKEKWK
jgi:patatin-like phospholipase/acyl hydrolase